MICPLVKLKDWLDAEKTNGNPFPQGAVLSTISKDRAPRSRVVSTLLNEQSNPVFYTSPNSRKFEDINFCNKVSLTYSFQSSLRSISIEASVKALNDVELNNDWLKFDASFRKHYTIFGSHSGNTLTSIEDLRAQRDALIENKEMLKPSSFIGYKLVNISRISFYSVKENDFAESILYKKKYHDETWSISHTVP